MPGIAMLAQAAGRSFTTSNNNTYTSDSNGFVASVAVIDINDMQDMGCLPVPGAPLSVTSATLVLTAASHAGRIIVGNKVDGQTFTLPAAAGTGNVYTLAIGATVTSVGTILQVANSSDIIQGYAIQGGSAGATTTFIAGASDDTITLNGSTKGGFKGDIAIIRDIAANVFQALVFTKITGTAATPFSSAV